MSRPADHRTDTFSRLLTKDDLDYNEISSGTKKKCTSGTVEFHTRAIIGGIAAFEGVHRVVVA
jgi:hypothetical protein